MKIFVPEILFLYFAFCYRAVRWEAVKGRLPEDNLRHCIHTISIVRLNVSANETHQSFLQFVD